MNPDIARAAMALAEPLAQPLIPFTLAMLPVAGIVLMLAILTWNGRRLLRNANRRHVRDAYAMLESQRRRS